MKLYHFPHSPNTRKVLAVINYLELDTELEMVNLLTGEQMKAEFIQLNPNRKTQHHQEEYRCAHPQEAGEMDDSDRYTINARPCQPLTSRLS